MNQAEDLLAQDSAILAATLGPWCGMTAAERDDLVRENTRSMAQASSGGTFRSGLPGDWQTLDDT